MSFSRRHAASLAKGSSCGLGLTLVSLHHCRRRGPAGAGVTAGTEVTAGAGSLSLGGRQAQGSQRKGSRLAARGHGELGTAGTVPCTIGDGSERPGVLEKLDCISCMENSSREFMCMFVSVAGCRWLLYIYYAYAGA
jgi:hypothetical protein